METFKISSAGPGRVLGDLQASIMEVLWRRGEGTVRDVCAGLGPDHNYKTVMTVLNRMVAKGVVRRRRDGRAYLYEPVLSRERFLADMSRGVMAGLVKDFGGLAVAQFVDVLDEMAPEHIAELRRLLAERSRP